MTLFRRVLGGSKPRQCGGCNSSVLQHGHWWDLHLSQPTQHPPQSVVERLHEQTRVVRCWHQQRNSCEYLNCWGRQTRHWRTFVGTDSSFVFCSLRMATKISWPTPSQFRWLSSACSPKRHLRPSPITVRTPWLTRIWRRATWRKP